MKEGKDRKSALHLLEEKRESAGAIRVPPSSVPSTSTDRTGKKRVRSEEDTPPNSKKKGKTFADVARESLKVAIVDRTHPEGKITGEHQKVLKDKLEEWQIEALTGTAGAFVPHFEWSRFVNDILRITCHDEGSKNFLSQMVKTKGGLWDGASLQVVGKDDIPKLTKVSIWLPEEYRAAAEVHRFVEQRYEPWNGDSNIFV